MISEEIRNRLMNLYADLQQALGGKAEIVLKGSSKGAYDNHPAISVKGKSTNIYVYPEAYRIETIMEWQAKSTYTGSCDNDEFWFFVDTSEECIGEVLRIVDYKKPSQKTEWKGPSKMRQGLSAEKFELLFKEFLRQADINAITRKSNGGKDPKYLDNNVFDGGKKLHCQYGHGAASKTPHINWWVLSIYYFPDNGRIIMGIESDRYPHLNQMNPISHKSFGKDRIVAVFYESTKSSLNYEELYESFLDVSEQIMKLGIVDKNTPKTEL